YGGSWYSSGFGVHELRTPGDYGTTREGVSTGGRSGAAAWSRTRRGTILLPRDGACPPPHPSAARARFPTAAATPDHARSPRPPRRRGHRRGGSLEPRRLRRSAERARRTLRR